MRKTSGHEEDRIQAAIVHKVRARYDVIVASVPNGGSRWIIEAIKLKNTGVAPGHPDLIIYAPGAKAYLMEVKAPGGTVSKQQRAFRTALEYYGFPVAFVWSVEAAMDICEMWNLPIKIPGPRTEEEIATGF